MEKYSIIRFFENGYNEKIKEGLTLAEAKEHCQDDTTSGINEKGIRFFDGFSQE